MTAGVLAVKDKTYHAWVGRRVVHASSPNGVRGVVNEPGKLARWWRVWWDNGRQTLCRESDLIRVPDERKPE